MIPLPLLKLALRVADPDDTTEDPLLQEYEAAAVAWVEKETGRYFGEEEAAAEFVVPGNGTPVLWLPEYASAVSAVKSRAYLGGTETTIATGDSDGWALRLAPGRTHGNQLIRRGGSLWDLALDYVVTATIGYGEGAAPADIRELVMKLVAGMNRFRTPAVTGTIVAEVPGWRETVNHHRRLV